MSIKELRIEDLKKRLASLEKEANVVTERIHLHQQEVLKGNMSFSGGNGRIWITPCAGGYDVSLSGLSLQKQMYPFMKTLVGRDCDGFKQKNKEVKNQPFWRVTDFEIVRQAVLSYADTRE